MSSTSSGFSARISSRIPVSVSGSRVIASSSGCVRPTSCKNATLPCTVSIGATVVSLTMASPVMAEPSSGCRELPSPGMYAPGSK